MGIPCGIFTDLNKEEFIVSTVTIVLLVILAILAITFVVLYFLGKRMQKKQEEQQVQIQSTSQTVSLLIIDKKRMKIKDAGLPPAVVAQTPKLMRGSKVPVVKAKAGPKIMTFICDAAIFDNIPVKKEVKAVVSGLYITSVKGLHGSITTAAPAKKGLRARLQKKYKEANAKLQK